MTKEELRENWKYEFESWESKMGSLPVAIVEDLDNSEGYDISKATVFELENGKFAVVIEEGCSCYSSDEAGVEVFPRKSEAMKSFNRWKNNE